MGLSFGYGPAADKQEAISLIRSTVERGIIPIEAKSSDRVTAANGRSVETFMAEHPDAAKVGLVVYPGNEVVELRRNVWGVPDWYLLGAL